MHYSKFSSSTSGVGQDLPHAPAAKAESHFATGPGRSRSRTCRLRRDILSPHYDEQSGNIVERPKALENAAVP